MFEQRRDSNFFPQPRAILWQVPRRMLYLERHAPFDVTIPRLVNFAKTPATDETPTFVSTREIVFPQRSSRTMITVARVIHALRRRARRAGFEEQLELSTRICVHLVFAHDLLQSLEHDETVSMR